MEDENDTPLMKQYASIKNEHKNEVLFFRLGDFYEMFDDDAKEVSRLLNLTLTHRGARPMCGIPFHAAKVYIARLLRLGKKIAICEQIGEVTGKTLAKRRVVEVITPGTAVDGSYLDGGQNNFLACLCASSREVGFAFIDVTTADFFATSWLFSEMSEAFPRELSRANPKELLLPESLKNERAIHNFLCEKKSISVSYYPDWEFDSKKSFERLKTQFGTQNLRSFSLSESSAEVIPAGFLLDYISRMTVTSSPHVSNLNVYKNSAFLMLDESSRRNLELTENLRDGSAQFSLLGILGIEKTAMGKRLMRSWILYPLLEKEKIIARQNQIARFFEDDALLLFVREKLSSVLDLERLSARVAMERAHAKDLQALRQSLESWISVCEKLGGENLEKANEIVRLINNSILDDPSTSISEGRLIKDGYSAELDGIRALHDNASRILEEYAEEEREKTGIQNLKIRRTDATGFFIEISRARAALVPNYFIMRRSLTNSDRFTTEKLQEIEEKINDSSEKIIDLEKMLFLEIRAKIAVFVPYLLEIAQKIALVDCASSLASVALRYHWTCPIVDDSSVLEIKEGRHPVVEQSLPSGEFVPNDALLDSSGKSPSFCLITGPNMAGKSTYLRQTALIVLLSQIGSFVPAKSARIGIVDRIFCRVGASDNLARGESTFLVEMTETAFILRAATQKSLVIMDEVGRGTSTEDGLSIAWAVSEHLLNSIRCKTLFATHYHELTRLLHPALRLLFMDVCEKDEKIVFLRKIKEGASENSYGIHVASLAGVPKNVILRAEEILGTLQSSRENAVVPNIKTQPPRQIEEKKSPSLFSDEELVLSELLSLDSDNITPRQALDAIVRWQNALWNEAK